MDKVGNSTSGWGWGGGGSGRGGLGGLSRHGVKLEKKGAAVYVDEHIAKRLENSTPNGVRNKLTKKTQPQKNDQRNEKKRGESQNDLRRQRGSSDHGHTKGEGEQKRRRTAQETNRYRNETRKNISFRPMNQILSFPTKKREGKSQKRACR